MIAIRRWPQAAATGALRVYQRVVSPGLPPACRFVPTCSEYALQAVERFGLLRGGWLALRRLGRCHPFHAGGYDPVPLMAAGSCPEPGVHPIVPRRAH